MACICQNDSLIRKTPKKSSSFFRQPRKNTASSLPRNLLCTAPLQNTGRPRSRRTRTRFAIGVAKIAQVPSEKTQKSSLCAMNFWANQRWQPRRLCADFCGMAIAFPRQPCTELPKIFVSAGPNHGTRTSWPTRKNLNEKFFAGNFCAWLLHNCWTESAVGYGPTKNGGTLLVPVHPGTSKRSARSRQNC